MARVVRLQGPTYSPTESPFHISAKPSACKSPLACAASITTAVAAECKQAFRLILLQGAPQRRQLAERIYAYEAALPEDLLQQGIGPPGNTNRLLKVFNKLMTGQRSITMSLS